MFNPSDVYVSGGSNDLLVCWTDKVTKHDASSFYNWEQDNLPIHDLEERTHLLWEKFGHPTSALTGMSFIVSADATDTCNPLYFTTLSACVAALPEYINYPILIEIASFGNLGGLNLSNKSFGPRGALEIVNRNASHMGARSKNGSARGSIVVDEAEIYGLASSIKDTGVDLLSLTNDSSGLPSLASDAWRSRLFTRDFNGDYIFISSSVNGWDDARYSNPYTFTRRLRGRDNTRMSVALSSTVSPWYLGSNPTPAKTIFETSMYDSTLDSYDVSTVREDNDSEIQWGVNATEVDYTAASVAYFNFLEYVKVNNCRGPVYLRNLNVDGNNTIDRGIEVKNSTVMLERCAASRCNKAGLYVDNSEVELTRGFVGYRNYEVVNSSRTGVNFSEKIQGYKVQDSYGAGIYCLNSTLNLKSTYDRSLALNEQAYNADYNAELRAAIVGLPNASSTIVMNPTSEELYCLSRNDIGIHSVNSNIVGGFNQLNGLGAGTILAIDDNSRLFCELNTEAGIKIENSTLDYSGRLSLDGNYIGIDSTNSNLSLDRAFAKYNQNSGFKLNRSDLTYNKDLYLDVISRADLRSYFENQLSFIQNGNAMECVNSTVKPVFTNSMPTLYNAFFASGSHGIDQNVTGEKKYKTDVIAKDNSNIDLVHATIRSDGQVPGTAGTYYGKSIRATDNSTVTLRGSEEEATSILGPSSYNYIIEKAGLYANSNSTINIQGPTCIARFGVDGLAEDGSNIRITPHQNREGDLLVSAFDLSSGGNHTMVELHSGRACLVANRNSNITMENLGHHSNYWSGTYANFLDGNGLTYDFISQTYETYASAGFVQFYPNANTDAANVQTAVALAESVVSGLVFQTDGGVSPTPYYKLWNYASDFSSISTGGMCVRALGNSVVNANNVHFPAGWHNTSSYAFDFEGNAPLPGPECTRIPIWNIADNSLLNASYLSVSANHPRDAGAEYWGPSGVWGDANGDPLSAAPETTPDTSSLSILDYYGARPDNLDTPYGKQVRENFGPFRLYFSVEPAANFLNANDFSGIAYQLFSQGYPSYGNLSSASAGSLLGIDPTDQYTFLKANIGGLITDDRFYYVSSMMVSPFTDKAILDDSALNTFANAKHNMVGKSGLARVVKGYYPFDEFGGDSQDDRDLSTGLRSVNNFDLKKDN